MISHYQAIAPISIFAEIACELAKTHPIKLEPSHTPPKPKAHINQTSTFWKTLQYGAAAIHCQCQTNLHHQAIANTPIIKKIA
jgi:hypothetical protein